jgi:hypothetical protein
VDSRSTPGRAATWERTFPGPLAVPELTPGNQTSEILYRREDTRLGGAKSFASSHFLLYGGSSIHVRGA